MRVALLVLAVLSPAGCTASNLWSAANDASTAISADSDVKGREWLRRASQAQGGQALVTHRVASLWMRDSWPGWLMRTLIMPWPENGQLFRQDILVASDTSRLTFVEGDEKDTGWGIQHWVTYRFNDEGVSWDPTVDPDSTVKFWLPTNAYFPFLAWRIQEATFVRYMGTEENSGRTLHRVFATWGAQPTTPGIDQYIVYIDEKTDLIAYVRYTVRDMGESIEGLMEYSDYRPVGDVTLPFSMRVVDAMKEDASVLHAYTVVRAEFDPVLAKNWLTPSPGLTATK